jgi:flagellar biosynthesis chaperone FliJ
MKLSEKELQKLKELQTKGNELIFSLGQIEAQKASVFNQIQEVQEEQNKLGKELQEKYGDGNINLETGEFTKAE